MTPTAERLRGEMEGLSETERAELALFLIQSLEPGADEDAESAWDRELARREEEIENGRVTGTPAEKVFTDLRAKYS